MREWMTIKDISEYLQVPESRIRTLINQKRIPFHDSHGFLRFNRQEIDNWMKTPSPKQEIKSEVFETENMGQKYMYRGRPIKDYMLAASKVLLGESALMRLPEFIKKTITDMNKRERDYLYREEFKPFLSNFNDYLRISCQIGLIDNIGGEEKDERIKRYYISRCAQFISAESDIENIKKIILDSILYIVKTHQEAIPDERHAIFLLWYYLKLRCSGTEPNEDHFRKKTDKPNNYYPNIRLGFAKYLCYFLFGDDINKERQFLAQWEQNI